MKQNIGKNDRILRLIIGIFLLILAVYTKSSFTAIAGLFTLYEAFSSWCVFYQLIGKNTCPVGKSGSKIDLKNTLFIGLRILTIAIILNIFSSLVGFASWYEFLNNPREILSWDNYLYLFFVYPFLLGLSASWKR